jgi:hypothetical protein
MCRKLQWFCSGISISLDPAAQNANILGPITRKISKCCVNKRFIVRAASAPIALLKSVFIQLSSMRLNMRIIAYSLL